MNLSFSIVLTSFLFLLSLPAAADDKLIFDADFMEKNSKNRTVLLRGNVNVVFQQQHLLCDEALINEETKIIKASGNVILQTPKTTLRGQTLEYDYAVNKGQVHAAVVTSGQVLIESDTIEKIGEEEYLARDAYYTACVSCPPSWGFTAKKIRAQIGGYAYIYRPWLYLLQLPVLPLPYLAVPLNSKRQTGFLVPQPIYTGQGGIGLEQSFFWAIDRSHDATFSARWYEKRGVQGLVNYRYVLSPKSSGELDFGFLRDRNSSQELRNFNGGRHPNRWFLDYIHYYDLPNDFVHRAQLQMASDPEYSRDFPTHFNYRGEAAFDNRTSITKNFDDAHLSVDASYYISQIEQQISNTNSDALHRVPQINFVMGTKKLADEFPLLIDFESHYLNVGRQGQSFDHMARNQGRCTSNSCVDNTLSNGSFRYYDPATRTGDLVRTGQRLDNIARLSLPFWVGPIFDMEPSATLRFTQYSLGVSSDSSQGYDSFPNRAYAQFNWSAKTYLSRTFSGSEETKFKHTIIPEIDYQVIPFIHQSNHRFFGTQDNIPAFREKQPVDDKDIDIDNGGRGIQFDFHDRIIRRHLINFSLTNKIFAKQIEKGKATYTRSLLFNISQAYDFREATQAVGRPWQDIISYFDLRLEKLNLYAEFDYFPYHARTNIASKAQYFYSGSNFFSLGYNVRYTIEEDPATTSTNDRVDSITLGTGVVSKYLDFQAELLYSPKESNGPTSGFKQWTILATIKPPGRCWLVNVKVLQYLDSPEPQFSISPEFEFGK